MSGKKSDLVERLEAFVDAQEEEEEDEEEEGDSDSEEEEEEDCESDADDIGNDENRGNMAKVVKPASAVKPARRMVAVGKAGRTFGLSLALQAAAEPDDE